MVLFGSGIRLVEAPEGFHRGADTTYPPVVRAGYTRAASLQGLRGAQSGVFEFECPPMPLKTTFNPPTSC